MLTPKIEASNTTFPFTLSVDADIPDGAEIRVRVLLEVADGLDPVQNFVNPRQAPLNNANINNFSFEILPPSGSIAIPFLYAIIIEGNKQRYVFDAIELAVAGTRDPRLVLVAPKPVQLNSKATTEITKPYLSRMMLPGEWVSTSDVKRPWTFEVIADTPSDTQVIVTLRITEKDGSTLEKQYHGPCREPIASTTFRIIGYSATLRASSDRFHTPFFYGVSFEGDGRCYYASASSIFEASQATSTVKSDKPDLLKVPRYRAERAYEPTPLLVVPSLPPTYVRVTEMYEQGKFETEQPLIEFPDWDDGLEFNLELDIEPSTV